MADVVLPRLPEDLDQGTLLRWHRASGDLVQRGDALADAGADAAFVTCSADAAGTLETVVPTGGDVAPGAVIARIHPAGRAGLSAAATTTAKGEVTVTEPTRPQQQIARRAAESRATVPTYDLEVEVDASALLDLKERLGGDSGAPTVTALLVKACGLALRAHPGLNAGYRDARFERFSRVNVGVQVDVVGAGIVVPTLFDADRRPIADIATDLRTLAARARDGSITPPETSGATFTLSSLGMRRVRRFAAVVTPPQAAVLAVGEVGPRAVVRDGAVVARDVVDLTLTCDHRIVYGAEAARFLETLRGVIEEAGPLAD